MTLTGALRGARHLLRQFRGDRRGNVAIIFAASLVPLSIAAGAGLDYWRAVLVRQQMAEALDAAALAVGSTPGLDTGAATTLAQKYFNANYKVDTVSFGTPVVQIDPTSGFNSKGSVTVTASDVMPTTVMRAAGAVYAALFGGAPPWTSMTVNASSTVVWGQSKLWVGLVLDNTGSMCEPDSSPCTNDTSTKIKINALKTASKNLLTTLQNASATPGDVMVAIAPFAKDVNVGTANVGASWIDWTDWNTAFPGTAPAATVGPGDACPFGSSYNGCLTQPGGTISASDKVTMTTTGTIPNSGTYAGYICPGSVRSSSSGMTGHYYNGCYTSVVKGTQVTSGNNASCGTSTNCSCKGKNSGKTCTATTYTHAWVTNPKSTWRGCVMDRTQSDDVNDATPGTKFPAENSDSCVYAPITQMSNPAPATTADVTTMFANLNAQIDNMVANGGTNQTIGLVHGMQLLTTGAPYNAPALPANTTRYIILLSDGLNTMDRWYGNGSSQSSSVDDRMKLACANAKTQGFIIYTIFVDLNGTQGSSDVLQTCASDTSKYFDLTTSSAIISTFNQIAQQITNVRVSQ